jgi:hypothetical protein
MRYLYKYPQGVSTTISSLRIAGARSKSRYGSRHGAFDGDRYFDVTVEYAKVPEDILIRITAVNRGPDTATLHVLPTLCGHAVPWP